MLMFILYLLLLCLLIYFNGFFGVFKSSKINRAVVVALFVGKALAVPVFYFLYNHIYGGIEKFDAGKFYHDAHLIAEYGKKEPGFFFRVLTGFQNEAPGSQDFENCLRYTQNWDNGTVKDYFYNDNRVVIRLHAFLEIFTFGSYLAQALFSCFLSFIGIFFLYRAFIKYFHGRDLFFLCVLCFFPALWFYTGATLKEGPCMFVMGISALSCRAFFVSSKKTGLLLAVFFAALISCFLKPYLLLGFLTICFCFFGLETKVKNIYRIPWLLIVLMILIVGAETTSRLLKQRTLVQAALQHQERFEAVSRGGVFLTDSVRYMQLAPDTSLITESSNRPGWYHIRKGTAFMYWEPNKPLDTLYCKSHTDTTALYQLIYYIPKSGSNIQLNKKSVFTLIGSAVYYAMFHPFFVGVNGPLQLLASFENFLVLLSLGIIVFSVIRRRQFPLLIFIFLLFAVMICVLVGITAPNSGAIFRYRAPALVFIVLGALYFLPWNSSKVINNKSQ